MKTLAILALSLMQSVIESTARRAGLGFLIPPPALALGRNDVRWPGFADFHDWMRGVIGQNMEVIRQPLYDTALYPTAGMTTLPFFQTAVGGGLSGQPGNANVTKGAADTNMQTGGSLPQPQGFFATSLQVNFRPGAVATANTFTNQVPAAFAAANAATVQSGAHDAFAFYRYGNVLFQVNGKTYLQDGPLSKFPPPTTLELQAAIGTTSATAGEVVKDNAVIRGDVYKLAPGIAIQSGVNFTLSLNWAAAVATPSGFNGVVTVTLDGYLFRAQ